MQDRMTFAALLSAAIDSTAPAVTRARLARHLGHSRAAVDNWISGDAAPRPAIVRDLLDALDLDYGTRAALLEAYAREHGSLPTGGMSGEALAKLAARAARLG
jgi:hypothetical protein